MRALIILAAASFAAAAAAAEPATKAEQAESARQSKIYDSIADMVFNRDTLYREGYAVFLESAATVWVRQKRLIESRPPGLVRYPTDGTDSEQNAWRDKWLAADPKTISKEPPPAVGVWNLSIQKPGFQYHASAYTAKRNLQAPSEQASEPVKNAVLASFFSPGSGTANQWSEYFSDGRAVWKFRRYSSGSPLSRWDQYDTARGELPEWKAGKAMAVFLPIDGLLLSDAIHLPLTSRTARLENRLLNRWQLLETSDGLRGQFVGRWRWTYEPYDRSLTQIKHTQDTTIVFDPGFGGMPVSIEQRPVDRHVNTNWFKTLIKWRKFGETWLPVEIDNTRSDHDFGDTETREQTVLHWTLGEEIPAEWFTSEDLRGGLLDRHKRSYCQPASSTPGGRKILSRAGPIQIPERYQATK